MAVRLLFGGGYNAGDRIWNAMVLQEKRLA